MAEATSLDAVLKLLTSLNGGGSTTTTSGGTRTEQTMLNQDTINATLRSALESNQGLANIAAGQNNSGMYNSTVNQQLTNDLLARLTTNAAVAGAPKVTTSTPTVATTKTPGIGESLLPIAALSFGKKGIEKLLAGDWELGGSAVDSVVGSGGAAIENFVNTTTLSGVESASSGGNAFLDFIGGSGAAEAGATAAVEGTGSLFGDGEGFLGMDRTVICTEAARQGLISQAQYQAEVSLLKLEPINPYVISGYHLLAAPVVTKMKKSFRVAKYFANWARAFIEGHTFKRPSAKYYFIRYVLFPLCFVIGLVRGKETVPVANSGV